MKKKAPSAWLSVFTNPHRVTGKDAVIAIVTGLLWWGAVQGRQFFIEPRCKGPDAAVNCSRAYVNAVDRIALGQENGDADGFSFVTQNISGYLAIGGPILYGAFTVATGGAALPAAAIAAGTDLLLLGQASALNGLFNEFCHAVSARPRPFVYSDPVGRGADPSHYTSFYSGHTSFAALAGLSLFLMLLARGAPVWLLVLSALSYQALTLSTAYFRVMAGRHFLTDTLVAAAVGSLVALAVFYLHKPRASR